MKSNLFRKSIIALFVGLFACGAMTAQTGYNITIVGTELTPENAVAINNDNFPGLGLQSGSITYDFDSKTFTFDNVKINAVDGSLLYISTSADEGVYKINLIGTNEINTSGAYAAVFSGRDVMISGSSLIANTPSAASIYITSNSTLTIKGASVEAKGNWGIAGYDGKRGEKLVIDNAKVKANGTDGSICDFQEITLTGCEVTAPEGAAVAAVESRGMAVVKDGQIVTTEVVITPISSGTFTLQTEPLSIYPNPANDYITINTEETGKDITITDLSGRVVMTANTIAGTTTLNVSQLPTGTYMVTVGNKVGKVVKE